MKIVFSWHIGCDSEEWRARLTQYVRANHVPATLYPQAESLLLSAVNPLQMYLLETADDIGRAFEIGVGLARKWWEAGLGYPTIALLTAAATWELGAGFGGMLPVTPLARSLFEIVVYKERVDNPESAVEFAFMRRFNRRRIRVYDLYYSSESLAYSGLLQKAASRCRLNFASWEPHLVVDESVVVVERGDVGGYIASAYEFLWREGCWRKPLGLVALAEPHLHKDLLRAQRDGRPLYMDVCSPQQLEAEGFVRVRRWRSVLEGTLREFYTRWQSNSAEV